MSTATILPQARTVFLDNNNIPISGGFVYMYVPNTTTPKTTWQDVGETTPNSNPIILDSQGSCLLYGSGQYTQEVHDSLGNLIWTGLTQDLYGLVVGGNNTFTGNNIFSGTNSFTGSTSLGSLATATTQTPGDNTTKVATDAFVAAAIAAVAAAVPYNAISGCLVTSITGTNTSASATITAGQAANKTNTAYITCAGYSWTASNGNAINGTDASSSMLADSSTYHMFLCSGVSGTGTFCSASLTPTFPTGYAASSRRIGSFNTDSGGGPISYVPIEVEGGTVLNYLVTQLLDVNSTSGTSASRTLYTLTVPSGIRVQPIFRAGGTTAVYGILTSPDETDAAPGTSISTPVTPVADIYNTTGGGDQSLLQRNFLTTNTSGQIGARFSSGSSNIFWFVTSGFKDFRRS